MSTDTLEAMAASATMALRASLTPLRYCQACSAALPYLGGRGRPRRWCDAHHPRPLRLRPRASLGAGEGAAKRPRHVRGALQSRDLAQVHPCAPTVGHVAQ